MPNQTVKKFILPAILSFSVVSCSSDVGVQSEEDPILEDNMNEDEAADRVEEHVDQAVSVLPAGVELEPLTEPIVGGCDGGGDDESVTVSHTYWLRELPSEDNESNAETLHQYWSNNHYEVLRDRRPDKLSISVQHTEDAFRMSLRESEEGTLSLGASSPCVQRDRAS